MNFICKSFIIIGVINKAKRCRASNNKRANYPDIENELNDELVKLRENGVNINGDLIIAHAHAIAKRKSITTFRGSRGWMNRFLERK